MRLRRRRVDTFGFSIDTDFRGMEFATAVSMEGAHSLPPELVVKEAEIALLHGGVPPDEVTA